VSARPEIISLVAPVADAALDQLAAAPVDGVEGSASVSFMAPPSHRIDWIGDGAHVGGANTAGVRPPSRCPK